MSQRTSPREHAGSNYMPDRDPPMVESVDPRGCLMKCCCGGLAVWSWQGCDNPGDIWIVCCLHFFCHCAWCFTMFCWKPAPRQKKFKPLGQEKKMCCCECNPLDKCCRFWFPCHAIYTWHGCDNMLDTILMIGLPVLNLFCCLQCYAACCWIPGPVQKVWGKSSMVGAPVGVAASPRYGSTRY
mmetsp:Transcript_25663/g.64656  ORF Transcript_25663/g.64656 Transcript_25663/m.64656 type:complete len:183 (+) Transcript_25663:91-639(+)